MRYNALFAFLTLFLLPTLSFSQLNMTLQDSMDYNVGVNDVCGWAAPDGKEYALVGINTGVSIVDINQDTLHEVVFVPGVDNLWRDINTYSHYAYVSSEAHIGLLIIDLQYLPDSVQTWVWKDTLPTPNGPKIFEKAHSLWTDEEGLLYLNGSNLNAGGVIICDIATDPTDPIFLGYGPAIYTHDSYSRDSIMYSAEIYAGNASIYDIHDPANVTLLGQVKTPYEFTHNIWLSDNSQYMFTTDERANSYVTSYDISDPGNIIELDRYRQAATEGLGNIVHNVYVWNDFVIVAYYANGTIILDGAHPDNLVEVGNFDSFLGQDGGFPGVWGSYPFLPSGKILASDRNNGLFVFIPNYVRAAYLEGTVVDSITHEPLDNAVVKIISDEITFPQPTKPDGTFKMGKAVPGQFDVLVTKEGYFDKTVTLNFINGEVLSPVIELKPIPTFTISGRVLFDPNTGVPSAQVLVQNGALEYRTDADPTGNFIITGIPQGNYEIQAGIWGWWYEEQLDVTSNLTMDLTVKRGYRDDFDLLYQWSRTGTATKGFWEREKPQSQLLYNQYPCGSDGDSPFDSGEYAYSTGLSTSQNVEDSEVNGGDTWLASPTMDFTDLKDPVIHFDYWLCEFPPNQYDGVSIHLSDGIDTILLGKLRNDSIVGSWQTQSYDSLPLNGPLDHMRVLVVARDTTTGTNFFIVKMHFDNFIVTGEFNTATEEPQHNAVAFELYPNPLSTSKLYLKHSDELLGEHVEMQLVDAQGRVVQTRNTSITALEKGVDVQLPAGIYLVHWKSDAGENGVAKLVVVSEE